MRPCAKLCMVVGGEPGNQRCCARALRERNKLESKDLIRKREYEGYEENSQYEQASFYRRCRCVKKQSHTLLSI